jgi:small ligand-binding sensory domain FIST
VAILDAVRALLPRHTDVTGAVTYGVIGPDIEDDGRPREVEVELDSPRAVVLLVGQVAGDRSRGGAAAAPPAPDAGAPRWASRPRAVVFSCSRRELEADAAAALRLGDVDGAPSLVLLLGCSREAMMAAASCIRERHAEALVVGGLCGALLGHQPAGRSAGVTGLVLGAGAASAGPAGRASGRIPFRIARGTIAEVDESLLAMRLAMGLDNCLLASSSSRRRAGAHFGLLVSCNARGSYFHGTRSAESAAFARTFPRVPLVGFFGGGELGPDVGERRTQFYAYTSIFALVPKSL